MFIKYPSLVNHYNVDPDYVDLAMQVVITEKLDGSNISLCIEPHKRYRLASRNRLVDDTWNGACDCIPPDTIERIQEYANRYNCKVNLFGEIFSSKILKRIPYGRTKIRWYDLFLNTSPTSTNNYYLFLSEIGNILKLHPLLITSLKEALQLDVEGRDSGYADAKAEGIVIRPWSEPIFNAKVHGIKKKSVAFIERAAKVNTDKNVDMSPKLREYITYLTSNRVLSILSKEEVIDKKYIGDYIKLVARDALVDYEKDTGTLLAEERRTLLKSSGKVIAPLVIKEIKV